MAIEMDSPALGSTRDSSLMDRWILKRLNVDKAQRVLFANPELPVTMVEDINWEANLLDTFIPLGIQRSRRWGTEEVAINSTRLLESLMQEDRTRDGL